MTRSFTASCNAYEAWLKASLRKDLDAAAFKADLDEKHERMAEGAFPFLRATYWRWCELVTDRRQKLRPLLRQHRVLCVGDIHVENYGTWRDREGRLVFGVNDFDEAAEMPWPIDLVRLTTSALLGARQARRRLGARQAASRVLKGYRAGMKAPTALVLDDHGKLREALEVVEQAERDDFWKKELKRAAKNQVKPGRRFADALRGAFPKDVEHEGAYARQAGLGSRGRPRYAAMARYQGGKALREVKALLPSAWTLLPKEPAQPNRTEEAAAGRYRSPDPWFKVVKGVACRRLSPNNRKIELPDEPAGHPLPIAPFILEAMGQDLAAVHAATPGARKAVQRALKGRFAGDRWLAEAAQRMAAITRAEHADFAASYRRSLAIRAK